MDDHAKVRRLAKRAQQAEQAWNWHKAASLYEACCELEPNNVRWATNLANCLWLADEAHDPRAVNACRRACRLASGYYKPWLGLGHLYRDLERHHEAELAYAYAMDVSDTESEAEIAWSRSQNLIGLQQYTKAYALAEKRLELADRLQPYRSGPYWEGWPTNSARSRLPKEITIWTEQGFGDTLQYVRWLLPLLKEGVKVTLEAESTLVRLLEEGLRWTGGQLKVVSKQQQTRPDLVGGICQGSLMSLPARLGGAPLSEAFEQQRGYLRLDPKPDYWPGKFKPQRTPRVGLVWASGNKNSDAIIAREYARRSLPRSAVEQLILTLSKEGAELISLQYGHDQDRAGNLARVFSDQLPASADFYETAEWMESLDLIVSVDTAYAHLAGALRRQTWVLLPKGPDPRWAQTEARQNWYQTVTHMYQDQPKDWQGLTKQVARKYRQWKNAHAISQ
jgi:tetratricopeptide (TPR) repeat protein